MSYPTLNFALGETIDMLRDQVQAFVADELSPRAAQIDGLALWRVAQAGIGAALPTDLDLTAGSRLDHDCNAVAIHLGGAKKLIAVFQPWGRTGVCAASRPSNLKRF